MQIEADTHAPSADQKKKKKKKKNKRKKNKLDRSGASMGFSEEEDNAGPMLPSINNRHARTEPFLPNPFVD